jgi:uncharacterized membrane protein
MLLVALLFLIPALVILISVLRNRVSKDTYPLILTMIALSVLIIFSLRSHHVLGHDVHLEYYFFHVTNMNSQWGILEGIPLDSCLGISVLPTVFHSLVKLPSEEYAFELMYIIICTFTPLVVYEIAKGYLGELYAFLAGFFVIAQTTFLITPGSPRTNLAIFFFAACIMALFHQDIAGVRRKWLVILFLSALIVSHYTTTYVCLIMFISALALSLLFRKSTYLTPITLTGVAFFMVLIFLWFGQLTQAPFVEGTYFISNVVKNISSFFLQEVRSQQLTSVLGIGLGRAEILQYIHMVVRWLSFAFIGVGVVGTFFLRKRMIIGEWAANQRTQFLNSRFELQYFLLAVVASGTLVITVLLPFVSTGYDVERLYLQTAVILAPFFILGAMFLSKYIKISAHWLVLIILIPYFLLVTGAGYELFGTHTSFLVHSEAPGASYELVYDQEVPGAIWLREHMDEDTGIYASSTYGASKLTSQGKISFRLIDQTSFYSRDEIDGYIYLNYNNVVNDKLAYRGQLFEMSDYLDILDARSRLYTNGGCEVYK